MATPAVGRNSPRNSLIAVLLPAPLGPSSPVTPGCTVNEALSRATVVP